MRGRHLAPGIESHRAESEESRIRSILNRLQKGIEVYQAEKKRAAATGEPEQQQNIKDIVRAHLDDLEAIEEFEGGGGKIGQIDSSKELREFITSLGKERDQLNKDNLELINSLRTMTLARGVVKPAQLPPFLPKINQFRQMQLQKQPEATKKYIKEHAGEIREIRDFAKETRETIKKTAQEFFNEYVFDTEAQKSKIPTIETRMQASDDPEQIQESADFMKNLQYIGGLDFEVNSPEMEGTEMGFRDYGDQIKKAIKRVDAYSQRAAERRKAAAV